MDLSIRSVNLFLDDDLLIGKLALRVGPGHLLYSALWSLLGLIAATGTDPG